MRNATVLAMARRPVTCTSCGYRTTPVSGFCPQCLERLPLGRRRIALVPLLAGGLLGALVLGIALAAALSPSAPGGVSLQPGATSTATSPSAASPATGGSPTASPTTGGSPAATSTAFGGASPTLAPTPSAVGSPGTSPPPTASPVASAIASPQASPAATSPAPTAVLGIEFTPSTSTDGDVRCGAPQD